MFKFNFDIETENEIFKNTDDSNIKKVEPETIEWYESQRVLITKDHLENLDLHKHNGNELKFENITIKYTMLEYMLTNITKESQTEDIQKAEANHTDLIPGVYEGGAKIWECTDDLLQLLSKFYDKNWWQDKRILDLGCGAGLLGLFAYNSSAIVHFQDYNKDVLNQITIPNILLNVRGPINDINLLALNDRLSCYSGDWEKYTETTLNDEKFDLILTAETIYNLNNQEKLLKTLLTKLKPDGIVLLAAKIHYFGVGGGIRQFEESANKYFDIKVLWKASSGVSREILELKIKR